MERAGCARERGELKRGVQVGEGPGKKTSRGESVGGGKMGGGEGGDVEPETEGRREVEKSCTCAMSNGASVCIRRGEI